MKSSRQEKKPVHQPKSKPESLKEPIKKSKSKPAKVLPNTGGKEANSSLKKKENGKQKQQLKVTKEHKLKHHDESVSEEEKSAESEIPELSLDDIVNLGGTKADLELLATLNDDEELVESGESSDEDLNVTEVQQFMTKIGLGSSKGKKKSKSDSGTSGPSSKTEQSLSADQLQMINSKHTAIKSCLIKPGDWLQQQFEDDPSAADVLDEDVLSGVRSFAERLQKEEDEAFTRHEERFRGSELRWYRTVLTSGTLSDKHAALSVRVQEQPGHALQPLHQLLASANKKGRQEALAALDSLKNLFISVLLPDNRKLRQFASHPFHVLVKQSPEGRAKRLLLWLFEDRLKDLYSQFLAALQRLSNDTVLASKNKVLGTAFELLASKPEQEKALLMLLVNKLGDPDHKVGSRASHHLTKLVLQHPRMKSVVGGEVQRLLFRPNVSQRAQYYAVCFLGQVTFTAADTALAVSLLKSYFALFKALVKQGDVESRLLSGLLTGVNHAFPFAKEGLAELEPQLDTLYKLVHHAHLSVGLQALALLQHATDLESTKGDRFYTCLYGKLLDRGLSSCSRLPLLLSLLLKAISRDTNHCRKMAFVKRIMQVCLNEDVPFICAALVLVSEIVKTNRQVLVLKSTASIATKTKPATDVNPTTTPDDDDDEHYSDVPSSGEDEEGEEHQKVPKKPAAQETGGSWLHKQNRQGSSNEETRDVKAGPQEYDPSARNPRYCGAERECLWELNTLAQHYHPTVALYAGTLMQGSLIKYSGDPLLDFTLKRFLDRFVFRNPKTAPSKTGAQGIQSARQGYVARGVKSLSVNSDEYLRLDPAKVPADERFLHSYLREESARKVQQEEEDSDVGSVDDEEFDDYLETFEKGFEGASDNFDLDFARELADGLKDSDDDSVSDLSDEEFDMSDDDDELEGLDDDDGEDDDADFGSWDGAEGEGEEFDEEDFDSDDGDDDEDELGEARPEPGKAGEKRKGGAGPSQASQIKMKKRKLEDSSSLFAAAEEFSHLLDEDNAGRHSGSSRAVANKDKASAKQLEWEEKRQRGGGWRNKKKKHAGKPRR